MKITKATDVALRILMVLAGEPERQATIEGLSGELAVPGPTSPRSSSCSPARAGS